MTGPATEAAVERGLSYLETFLRPEEHFKAHWHDFVFEFHNIARTATDPELSARARRTVEEVVVRAKGSGFELGWDVTLGDCDRFAKALHGCEMLGIEPVEPRERVEFLTRRLTSAVRRYPIEPTETAKEDFERRCRNLINAYIGLSLNFPVHYGFAEALADCLELRPYEQTEALDARAFIRLGFLVTHIVYTVSHYNELLIDPGLLEPERRFMCKSIERLIDIDERELVGEYLDALRTAGLSEEDPLLDGAVSWLVGKQNSDGSWGDPGHERTYKRYHPTMTAVQGLRAYKRTGRGPEHAWVTDLLAHSAPVSIPGRAPDDSPSSPDVSERHWPLAPPELLRHAIASRPLVVRGLAEACPASARWSDDYLVERVGDVEVDVEVSPDRVFAHPERDMTHRPVRFADYLRDATRGVAGHYLAQVEIAGDLAPIAEDLAFEDVLPAGVSSKEDAVAQWQAFCDTPPLRHASELVHSSTRHQAIHIVSALPTNPALPGDEIGEGAIQPCRP